MNLPDLVAGTTVEEIKAKILAFATAAGLKTTAWLPGDPSLVIITIIAQIIFLFSLVIRDAIRSQFLDLATDPGDDGSSTPAKGWLSARGEGDYGTPRLDATFANGLVTLTNTSASPHPFGADELTFQNSTTGQTYRNSYDPTLYPLPDLLLTLLPGAVLVIPIEAEERGTIGNAAPGEISILETGLVGVLVTNVAPVLGADREPADAYRERCRIAASATSPNGPADAYRYIATSARSDGTFGQSTTGTRLNINRVQVTKQSAYGDVDLWTAGPGGAADPGEFTIANGLIQLFAVPDCITYTGHNSTEQSIAIDYSVEVQAIPGLTSGIILAAIAARLTVFFPIIPIGGFKNTGLAGTVFASRLRGEIVKAHPAIVDATVTTPAGNVALLNGRVATLGAITGTVAFS